MSRESMRSRFAGMHARCYDPTCRNFKRYGARGIYVCARWHDFDTYCADLGDPPGPGYSVDRIDNDGPYSPENCRWATHNQQARNRSDTHKITVDGVTQSLTGWAESSGIPRTAIRKRLKLGWPERDAVTIPITTCGYRRRFHRDNFKGRHARDQGSKPMTKPDLMAELAEVVRKREAWAAANTDEAWNDLALLAVNFVAHHAELEAMAMKAVPASELAALLPGVYYMDPPDGGDVSVIEQLRRMAKDAARYRHIKLAPPMHYHFGSGKALDAAIDHAMRNSAREG